MRKRPKSARDTNETIEFNQFFFSGFVSATAALLWGLLRSLFLLLVTLYRCSDIFKLNEHHLVQKMLLQMVFSWSAPKFWTPWMQTFKVPTTIQYYLPEGKRNPKEGMSQNISTCDMQTICYFVRMKVYVWCFLKQWLTITVINKSLTISAINIAFNPLQKHQYKCFPHCSLYSA